MRQADPNARILLQIEAARADVDLVSSELRLLLSAVDQESPEGRKVLEELLIRHDAALEEYSRALARFNESL
jgi:hypothetical protein